jgi:hypothetical protein
MTIPQHPFRSQWQPIEINMMGYRIVDTIEGAALEAIIVSVISTRKKLQDNPLGYFQRQVPMSQNGISESSLRVIDWKVHRKKRFKE